MGLFTNSNMAIEFTLKTINCRVKLFIQFIISSTQRIRDSGGIVLQKESINTSDVFRSFA